MLRRLSKLSDNELVALAVKDHSPAVAELIERHKGMVFTLAFRLLQNHHDAEEAAQDAFVKAFRSLQSFRADSQFATWLYRICYNTCLTRLRKAPTPDNADYLAKESAFAESVFDELEHKDRVEFINAAMAKLPPDEATIITLFYMDDMPIAEIAEVTAITEGNVKVKLFRGRKRLLVYLEEILKHETASLV
ncbi:ECF RNA polymerase sigma factor SigW [anaerobic digester metagenome]|jgi:RNA polymerase sigma-70 factor (ECF subfamily)|nr:RNA polymerase sigma factor [Tenuifilaceae bacterium]